jgi:hypothetical protein
MDLGQIMSQQPQVISAVLMLSGTMMLMQAVSMAINIWDKMRRKPSLDQELQFYAKKADLASVEARLRDELTTRSEGHDKRMEAHCAEQNKVVDNIFTRINSSQRAIEETFRQILHELGKVSGRTEKK